MGGPGATGPGESVEVSGNEVLQLQIIDPR